MKTVNLSRGMFNLKPFSNFQIEHIFKFLVMRPLNRIHINPLFIHFPERTHIS